MKIVSTALIKLMFVNNVINFLSLLEMLFRAQQFKNQLTVKLEASTGQYANNVTHTTSLIQTSFVNHTNIQSIVRKVTHTHPNVRNVPLVLY